MTWPFENNTSRIIKKLARRSMKADRRRSAFVLLTIGLTVCLMGILCFHYSATRLQTFAHIQGQYQAGCSKMSHKEMERLVAAGKFEKWGYTTNFPAIRYKDCNLQISFVDPGMRELMGYDSIIGAYPQTEQEFCVERAFLEYCGLPVETGQKIVLDLGDGEQPYIVTGILEKDNKSRDFTIWISEAAVKADGREAPFELQFRFKGSNSLDTHKLREDIYAFFADMGIPEERIFFSSNYFNTTELYLGSGMEIYGLAALIAGICAVVIYNIFYISVMGKLREYGRLKVLGATPKQLKKVVKRERNHLAVTAIPLGLTAAAIITERSMPGFWSWRDNIPYGAAISLVVYGVVLVATRKPLQLAGKVSAMEAVRASAYSRQPGRGVSRQLHRRLTMQRLAWINFSRNPKKAVVTSLSLSLTGILFLCTAAWANSVDMEEMALSQFGDRSQYLLQYENYIGQEFLDIQKDNPLGEELKERLASFPGVDHLTAYSLACVQIPEIMEEEAFYIRGLDEEQMSALYTDETILEGHVDYQQLLDGDGILICPAGDTLEGIYKVRYHIGDRVTISGYNGRTKTYTVQGIVEHTQIGSSSQFFILPLEEFFDIYPEITDFTAYLNIHADQNGEQLRQAIFEEVSDGRITIEVLDDRIAELKVQLTDELKRFYGILLFIFIFALINLANTWITNLLARQQELGIFQSVGMGGRQLSRMLSFECLYYIGITMLSTLTVGVVLSRMICHYFDSIGMFGKITYRFPLMQVLLFALALLAVQAIFSFCAVLYAGRSSLVDRMKALE